MLFRGPASRWKMPNYDRDQVSWEEFYIYGIVWTYYFILGLSLCVRPRRAHVFRLQFLTTLPAWIGYAQEHFHDEAWVNSVIKIISLGFTNLIFFRFQLGLLQPFHFHPPSVNAIYLLLDLFLAEAQLLYWFGPRSGVLLEQGVCLIVLSASVTIAFHVIKLLNNQNPPEELQHFELVFFPPRPEVDMSGDGSFDHDF